jgi:hypothetical protein
VFPEAPLEPINPAQKLFPLHAATFGALAATAISPGTSAKVPGTSNNVEIAVATNNRIDKPFMSHLLFEPSNFDVRVW